MTKDENQPKGMAHAETIHSMKRRCLLHDYYAKGTYMLTLVVEDRRPLLGHLAGGSPEEAHVELSPLGKVIRNEEIRKIPHFYPQVEVWKLCIMPDHIHMILRVKEDMPQGKHLGQVVAGFKGGCSRAARALGVLGAAPSAPTPPANAGGTKASSVPSSAAARVPSANAGGTKAASVPSSAAAARVPSASAGGHSSLTPLFEPGYNDKLLLREGQLANWKHYLDDNPRRLMMKRLNPRLFTVLHDMTIADHKCQIVGNRFLLDIPDKVAVIVHRRYTDEENARLRAEWLACGERGGVLVSAAIAPKEKQVLREAMNRGYSIILLRENGFPELYKPSGESFDACAEGRLLQVSPWNYHTERMTITRAQCLELNEIAEKIAKTSV